MTHPKPETEKRRTPNLPDYVSMLIRFGICPGFDRWGMAVKCGKPLHSVKVEYDHDIPLWAGGTNEPENWVPLCSACHLLKSKIEATKRAESDRMAGRRGSQYARRKKNGSKLQGNSKLQSGGFQKHPTLKRGFDGKVVPR